MPGPTVPPAPPAASGPSPVGRPARVLVVDDNADAADTLAVYLRLFGHTVAVAYCGPTGLAAVPALRPHVALLDLGLPGMDGFELAARVRAAAGADHLRLVAAVSGFGREADRERALAAGFDLHLLKPVHPNDLLRLIAAAVGSP